MERITIETGTFGVNTSILIEGERALIVDPGSEGERILGVCEQEKVEPTAILLTHAHFDHIGAIPYLQERYLELPVYVHADDVHAFTHPMNAYPPDYPAIPLPKNIDSQFVIRKFENSKIEIITTPGHTPGSVCYYFKDDKLLLSGDTLFAGSVGRTDLPGGNVAALMRSLEKLKVLPKDTVVVPGHGSETTIEEELCSNSFLR